VSDLLCSSENIHVFSSIPTKHVRVTSDETKVLEQQGHPPTSRQSNSHRKWLEMQQAVLYLLKTTFDETLKSSEYQTRISNIKYKFLNRDYDAIFSNDPSNLSYYVAEYSPMRALCYADLAESSPALKHALQSGSKVHCMGGGSCGELVGFASFLQMCPRANPLEFVIQDYADYTDIVNRVSNAITTTFPKSNLLVSFQHSNVLDDYSPQTLSSVTASDLITCMFILNELLAESKANFVTFIKRLLSSMKSGALLLIVDSAGSFSDIQVASGKRIYSVWMLLDAISDFETVEREDSRWFRLSPSMQTHYPVKVNNCRYFLRIYRKK